MTSWAGTTRASTRDLADVRVVGGQTTAVAATGEVAAELRGRLDGGAFNADGFIESNGEFAIIERGAVHAFVRVSPGATVILRDAEGYVERVSGETRMYPLEMVSRAVMVVGVPSERIDLREIERWLLHGAPAAAIDRLVAAWGHYGVVVVEGWDGVDELSSTLKTSRSQFGLDADDAPESRSYTIPPLAMLTTEDPAPERRSGVPMPYHPTTGASLHPPDVGTPTMDFGDEVPPLTESNPMVHRRGDDQRVLAALGGALVVLVLFLMAGLGYAFLL